MFFLLSALLLGHLRARAAAPKPSDCFLRGTERICFSIFSEPAKRSEVELFRWCRRKQKERSVQGAGFSPEAVPSNRAEGRTTVKPNSSLHPDSDNADAKCLRRINGMKLQGAQREGGEARNQLVSIDKLQCTWPDMPLERHHNWTFLPRAGSLDSVLRHSKN